MIKNLIKNLAKDVQSLLYKLGLIADYVVEQGTDGIWTYEKWESGKAVCIGQKTISVTYSFKIGEPSYLYQGTTDSISLPSGLFTSVKKANANGWNTSDHGWGVWCGCYNSTSEVKACPIAWCTGGTLSQVFEFEVIGKWK